MASVRKQVVVAWVVELVELGEITQQEADAVLGCLEGGNSIEPLICLSRNIGDSTPLEILAAGWSSNGNTCTNCGRPCFSPGRFVPVDR